MKDQEKRRIGILIIVGLLVILIIFFLVRPRREKNEEGKPNIENIQQEEYVQELEDGTKYNTSTKLKEPKKLEGLEISNIQLTHEGGQSVVLAIVVNTSKEVSQFMVVTLTLLDKEGNTIGMVNGIIPSLKVGEKTQLNMGLSQDCANAYDFTVVKN